MSTQSPEASAAPSPARKTMPAIAFFAVYGVIGLYAALITVTMLASGAGTEDLGLRMRARLADSLGFAAGDAWSATGVIATITVAAVVIVSAAGSRLSQAYAAWEESPGSTEKVRVERQRALGLLLLQLFLYLATIVVATGTAVHGAWVATAILLLLAALLLVETLRFLQDVWSDPGVFDRERLSAANARLREYSQPGDDAPSAFFVWILTFGLVYFCQVAPLVDNALEKTTSLVFISAFTAAAAGIAWLPAVVLRRAESVLGAERVVTVAFAYVAFALFSAFAIALAVVFWQEPSIPQFGTLGFCAALGLVGIELLRLLGIQDLGPLRAFSEPSRTALEQLRDSIEATVAERETSQK